MLLGARRGASAYTGNGLQRSGPLADARFAAMPQKRKRPTLR
jgi:hypothetical protein